MKKTKLRPRSRKREAEWTIYLKKRAEFLTYHVMCDARIDHDCLDFSEDVHHRMGRSGKLLNNTRYWLAVCRPCHVWIESKKREARRLKLILYK